MVTAINREELNLALQAVGPEALEQLVKAIEEKACVKIVKPPTVQSLLLPVYDPIVKAEFYVGEVLVTATVAEVNGVPGWAMVMDDQPVLSQMMAVVDAAFAAGIKKADIIMLGLEGEHCIQEKHAKEKLLVEKTRISFDLM
ncbi:MAG: phosphonate C-P lyase system protein PhnG [Deltaproteobacteria bacterium]|nr:phosphonate C-P lyase system protein PhnG [Candidatus Anaeroferrophillus wilburensis]MBN2890190.1 phosphonate C-P lyase system protein PhnG [Deltaproteobacteria bacterium]